MSEEDAAGGTADELAAVDLDRPRRYRHGTAGRHNRENPPVHHHHRRTRREGVTREHGRSANHQGGRLGSVGTHRDPKEAEQREQAFQQSGHEASS